MYTRRELFRGLVDPGVWRTDRDGTPLPFAVAEDQCLAWRGVMCELCADPCPENAVVFEGLMNPVVNEAACTGCALCEDACPAGAIRAVARNAAPRDDGGRA